MTSKRDGGLAAVAIVAKTAMPLILDFYSENVGASLS